MGLGDFVRGIVNVTKNLPRETVRATKKPMKGKKALSLLPSAGILAGTAGVAKGTLTGIEQETQQKAEREKFEAIAEQTEKQAAFEATQTEKEKVAKRKAAEEKLARRRATPGRPVFTSLVNRGSLLR